MSGPGGRGWGWQGWDGVSQEATGKCSAHAPPPEHLEGLRTHMTHCFSLFELRITRQRFVRTVLALARKSAMRSRLLLDTAASRTTSTVSRYPTMALQLSTLRLSQFACDATRTWCVAMMPTSDPQYAYLMIAIPGCLNCSWCCSSRSVESLCAQRCVQRVQSRDQRGSAAKILSYASLHRFMCMSNSPIFRIKSYIGGTQESPLSGTIPKLSFTQSTQSARSKPGPPNPTAWGAMRYCKAGGHAHCLRSANAHHRSLASVDGLQTALRGAGRAAAS